QPDGPSRQHNEPCATVSVRSSTAAEVPKNFVSASSSTTAMNQCRGPAGEAVHYISRESRESPLLRGWRRAIDTRCGRRAARLSSGDAVILEPGEHLGPAILGLVGAVARP